MSAHKIPRQPPPWSARPVPSVQEKLQPYRPGGTSTYPGYTPAGTDESRNAARVSCWEALRQEQ